MWIGDVDIPQVVLEAHRVGTLVVFVGAGASRDAPSSLPDFRDLAASIATDAQFETTPEVLAKPDILLGQIADRQVDVHLRVAAHIRSPGSTPNRLHVALADLALAAGSTRIVTTNYDLHLSTALTMKEADFEEYTGPALPMGDDFDGIVYLHWNLRQEHRRLVVTDADFGRAYLRDAWAARFLERMFAEYTVLFVGYSHGDVVMRYLARALGPGAPRYALTASPDAPDWGDLGIHALGYPVVNGSHLALVATVEDWSSMASMGLLDQRRRISQLVTVPPSQVPQEASYLESVIADPSQVRLFTDSARGAEWLSWAATQPAFRTLFDPSFEGTEGTLALAEWFTEHFVMDEGLSDGALRVVREAGGRIGPALWFTIGRHLHMKGSPRPRWLGSWVVLLIENDRGDRVDWLEYALKASSWIDDPAAALLLFDYLTEPESESQKWARSADTPRFEVRLRGSSYWLEETWRTLFTPNLAEAASSVVSIADHHLRRAHLILATSSSAQPGWDPVSFHRSAIDPHPQDRHRDPTDLLIDAARDSLESLLAAGHLLGPAYISAWAGTSIPILRRLAVHGWTQRRDVGDTAKIGWLHERGWLFDHPVRHEVFRLIEVALSGADPDVADALVSAALVGPDDVLDSRARDYETFNTLAWMTRHAPDVVLAREAYDELRARHPTFVERDHPDLLSWFIIGSGHREVPMTVEDLHQRIGENAAEAVNEVLRYQRATDPFDGPSWDDAARLVGETVATHPTDGLAMIDATGGDDPELAKAVISGWSGAAIEADLAQLILSRLASLDPRPLAESVTRLLRGRGAGDTNATEWHRYPRSRSLANDLWAVIEEAPAAGGVDGWLSRALNSPAGGVAEFWINAVADDWRRAGEDWAGLPLETQGQLENLLAGDDARTEMVEVVFSTHVFFFFSADRTWCETHVLPLLDWVNHARGARTWDGYLAGGGGTTSYWARGCSIFTSPLPPTFAIFATIRAVGCVRI